LIVSSSGRASPAVLVPEGRARSEHLARHRIDRAFESEGPSAKSRPVSSTSITDVFTCAIADSSGQTANAAGLSVRFDRPRRTQDASDVNPGA
jgi:hypothetical protein